MYKRCTFLGKLLMTDIRYDTYVTKIRQQRLHKKRELDIKSDVEYF